MNNLFITICIIALILLGAFLFIWFLPPKDECDSKDILISVLITVIFLAIIVIAVRLSIDSAVKKAVEINKSQSSMEQIPSGDLDYKKLYEDLLAEQK